MPERYQNILIVGSGAREHALGWKIAKDQPHKKLFFAPGNGGTAEIGKNLDIDATDIDRLVSFSIDRDTFTIVGPEQPLTMGLVDAIQQANQYYEAESRVFGPSQAAARLESSKIFATDFMIRHNIPHPKSRFFSNPEQALNYLGTVNHGEIVIKADGLAEGKGVVLPDTLEEAEAAVRDFMVNKKFGEAGEKIVIQERLRGREVSIIALVSNTIGLLPIAKDYKRAFDDDLGSNTGGMGAYSPSEISNRDLAEIYANILYPTQQGMIKDGNPFKGALFVGIMMTDKGPKVIEYNVRFGDPETQVMMRRLGSRLYPLLYQTTRGILRTDQIITSPLRSAGVVIASNGYPGEYEKGKRVLVSPRDKDIVVFHGGTINRNGRLESNGGRVLTVTAIGENRQRAARKIYNSLDSGEIEVDDSFFRRDIAV